MNKEITNKKFWEKAAKLYTPMQERKNAKLYLKLCNIISKSLDKNMQVLELACGTGQLTFPLCNSTILVTIASPNPVPPVNLFLDSSAL